MQVRLAIRISARKPAKIRIVSRPKRSLRSASQRDNMKRQHDRAVVETIVDELGKGESPLD